MRLSRSTTAKWLECHSNPLAGSASRPIDHSAVAASTATRKKSAINRALSATRFSLRAANLLHSQQTRFGPADPLQATTRSAARRVCLRSLTIVSVASGSQVAANRAAEKPPKSTKPTSRYFFQHYRPLTSFGCKSSVQRSTGNVQLNACLAESYPIVQSATRKSSPPPRPRSR